MEQVCNSIVSIRKLDTQVFANISALTNFSKLFCNHGNYSWKLFGVMGCFSNVMTWS